MGKKGPAYQKAFTFAVKIVHLSRRLRGSHEFVLSDQILKSGTSIGANIREGIDGQSKRDFISKMAIALKEACETEYWLDLLRATGSIDEQTYLEYHGDVCELIRILTAILVTSRKNYG